MRNTMRLWVLLALGFSLGCQGEAIPGEEIVHDGGVTKTTFVKIVDAPLDKVEAALWAVEDSSKSVENVKLSQLVKSEGNTKVLKMQLKASMLPIQQYTMEFTHEPAENRIRFKTLESQFQNIEGSYDLADQGGKTVVTYRSTSTAKVAVPFPQGVLDGAARETFENTIRGVAKTVGAPGVG